MNDHLKLIKKYQSEHDSMDHIKEEFGEPDLYLNLLESQEIIDLARAMERGFKPMYLPFVGMRHRRNND